VVHVSWWLWLIVAWFVVSVPFAVITAKFIAVGREHADAREPETVVDLKAAEAAEAANAAEARPRPSPDPASGSQPARSS
jgi:hypothetical protein